MSKTDTWFPLYVGDYLAATTRLTTEQHGAYLLIIMDYWRNGPPPDDDGVLARITGLTPARWKAHREAIKSFFQLVGKTWHHKRIDAELDKANAVSKARQASGKLGGEAKANAVANAVANAKQKPTQSQSQSQKTFTVTKSQSPSPQDQKPSDAAIAAPALKTAKRGNGKEKPEAPTTETWAAYATSYEQRYHTEPVRNAKVNGMMARFCERVPIHEAPQIAAFFVRSNRGLYVSAHHAIDLMLRDAEGLRTEWATGHQGTETEARQADKTAATGNVFGKLIEEAEEREKIGATL